MRTARQRPAPHRRAATTERIPLALGTWATLGGLLVAAVYLTNWPSYQWVVLGLFLPLYYYAVPGAVALPIVFAQPRGAEALLKEPLFWWFVCYVTVGAIWLLLSQDFMEEASGQWRLRVLAFFMFASVAIISWEARHRTIGLAILGAVFVAGVFNWWDFLRPNLFIPAGLEESNPGRGAGMFINSNAAAAFVTAGTIAALPFVPLAFRTPVLLFPLVGVAPTFSRSGLLCAAMVITLAMILRLVKRAQIALVIVGLAALVAVTAFYKDQILSSSDEHNVDRVVERLAWFQNLRSDDAINDRVYPALRAWEMFLNAPVTGNGTGVTSRPSLGDGTHNMYLMMMAEHGFLGFLLYASLLGAIALRGWTIMREAPPGLQQDIGRAMMLYAAFIGAYGCFSHNVLEEPHGIFLIGFLFAAGTSATQAASHVPVRAAGADPTARPVRLRLRAGA